MNRKGSLRYLGYILWFLFFTLLFAVINFPPENLTSWVNGQLQAASDGVLRVEKASPYFPVSLKMRDVSIYMGDDQVVLGDAVVTPSLIRLFTGGQGARVRISGPWGSSRLSLRSGGEKWGVEVGSFEADLGNIPLPDDVPYRMSGSARMEGNLLGGRGSSEKTLDGQGEIRGEGIRISGGLLQVAGLSSLEITGLSLFFTIEDAVLSLGENQLEGDLNAKARGTVRLVPGRFEDSRLDLIVEIKPGDRIKQKVLPLLTLAGSRPRADGSLTLHIRGTIGRPSITG